MLEPSRFSSTDATNLRGAPPNNSLKMQQIIKEKSIPLDKYIKLIYYPIYQHDILRNYKSREDVYSGLPQLA